MGGGPAGGVNIEDLSVGSGLAVSGKLIWDCRIGRGGASRMRGTEYKDRTCSALLTVDD